MNFPSGPTRKPLPTTLGKYEVRAKIGEGGMATVYVGRQRSVGNPDRLVALKVIKDEFSQNREFTNMFIDEAQIVARLSHPSIVKLFELGNEGGRLFIAMELLFGQSLWDAWEACRGRGVRMQYELVAWIGARVADGLHHAHELEDAQGNPQHIVHRDVNASNVFVTYDGDIKIIDFGLAKAINRVSKTAAGVVKGKLAYLSPEQAIGQEIDRRADIFALGTTLWELTVDKRLFRHKDDIETLKRIHAAVVPEPKTLDADYPDALWTVIKRSLARDPAARFQTAADMAKELDAFAKNGVRPADRATVSALMTELFPVEKERQAAWLSEASLPQVVPLVTLRPPSRHEAGPIAKTPLPTPTPRVSTHPQSGLFAPAAVPPGAPPDDPRSPEITVAVSSPRAQADGTRRPPRIVLMAIVVVTAVVVALVLILLSRS